MQVRTLAASFALLLFMLLSVLPGEGQKAARTVPPKAIQQSKKAVDLLELAMSTPDARIPKALLIKAVAVAVVTDVKSFGFLIEGAAKGRGVVTRRYSDGRWSPPAYIFIRAISIRPQMSANEFDVILLFMNDKSADWLLNKKNLTFDRHTAPTGGPIGEIRTEQKEVIPVADVFAYVFDDARLQSADLKNMLQNVAISFDNDLNRSTYGVTAADILDELHGRKPTQIPTEVMPFSEAVARFCTFK
jgi:lipid-binding SYLF domain-containing protein